MEVRLHGGGAVPGWGAIARQARRVVGCQEAVPFFPITLFMAADPLLCADARETSFPLLFEYACLLAWIPAWRAPLPRGTYTPCFRPSPSTHLNLVTWLSPRDMSVRMAVGAV